MSDPESDKRFWGKYQGTVVQNVDPKSRGRVMCTVPTVLGLTPSNWCEACTPLSGSTAPMGVYCVPQIGSAVWVEFEGGDPQSPILAGCRWDSPTDVPPLAKLGNPIDPNIVIQSLLQHSIMISDMPPTPATGGIILKSTSGAMIVVNDSGIYLSNGKGATISMVGTAIDFNVGALTILK
jgi:hypothetical protein